MYFIYFGFWNKTIEIGFAKYVEIGYMNCFEDCQSSFCWPLGNMKGRNPFPFSFLSAQLTLIKCII